MPQLFSRIDDMNWLTPSIADILDQGAAPVGDAAAREQALVIQRELAEMETPARVIQTRSTPTHTLFVLQAEQIGRGGSRHTVTAQELRRSIAQMAERHRDWRLGFMPSLSDQPEHAALLLRTAEHKPLSLRRMLVQPAFRTTDSYLTFPVGQTLDQQLIVRDLNTIEHLLIVGEGNARKHLLTSTLVTLALFNTPAELRLAIAGDGAYDYSLLTTTPHSLGKHLKDPQHVHKLIDGLASESQRRLNAFYEQGVNHLTAYNTLQKQNGKLPLPRIVLALDSLSGLATIHAAVVPQLRDLILNGAQAGLHLIYTVDSPDLVPPDLAGLTRCEVVLRSVAPDYMERLKGFHPSLLRFIDAFVLDRGEESILPVELCAVAEHEVRRTVDYWTSTADQRKREDATSQTSGRTGVTGFLRTPDSAMTATTATTVTAPPARTPEARPRGTAPLPPTVNLAQQQATALTAYLGWISAAPLRDVLLLSEAEALEMLDVLKRAGVIEQTDGPVFRFMRLAEPPAQ